MRDKITSEEELVDRRFVKASDDKSFAEVVATRGGYKAGPTVARPADTAPYTAGDVVGGAAAGAIELASIGPEGGHILVTGADLTLYLAAVPSGMGSFRAHFYDANPASALADNAAWTLAAGDRDAYLGYIDLGTPALLTGGGTPYVQADQVNKQLKLADGQTSLWIYLQTMGAYTPGSGDQVRPRFRATSI